METGRVFTIENRGFSKKCIDLISQKTKRYSPYRILSCLFFKIFYNTTTMNDEIKNNSTDSQGTNNDVDDVVIEKDETLDDSVLSEDTMAETIKKLREKVKKLEGEKQEYLTGWQRAKADYLNSQKREEENKKDIVRYATERIIDDLIPVLGSFDMAFANKEAWEKVDINWRVGVEYIYNHLKQVLDQNGLEEVNPIGQPFDINRDEAIEYVKVDDESKDGEVVEVIQKGFKLNGKILKPAKVKIGEYKSE